MGVVDVAAHAPQEGVRLGQVLAVRAVALVEVRHGVQPEAVEAEVEPEAQRVEHRLPYVRIVVVEVGLVMEEAMPVVRPGDRIPRPVGDLRVGEDDAGVLVARIRVRPHVPVALRRVGARARLLEPRVVARGVVHDEVGDHAHAELVRLVDEAAEVLDDAVVGMDAQEVRDVIAAVLERRRVHRQEPHAVDPEPLEVLELLGEPAQVARARRRCRRRTRGCGSRRRPRA